MSDLIEPQGVRRSLEMTFTLAAGRNKGGFFYAVIRDPETRHVISEIPLCRVETDEALELLIECVKDK